jgi:signal transduction histidine kinase
MSDKHTLLLVDDELRVLEILEGYLTAEGYQLNFATNGPEALTQVEKVEPDVILLDVMMPKMDGFEVCRRLKADERWQHIPIILVTALGSKEDIVRGLDAGANDFIRKPMDKLELQARVRSMLRIKKQYDKLQAALQLREDMAYMLVHDMKTPLNIISGYSQLLLIEGSIPGDVLKHIKRIQAQADYLNAFLQDMLIMAKMDAEQLFLALSLVDLNQLIQKAEEGHRIIAHLKQIKLIFDLPDEPRQVLLDNNLFQRVLDNLMSNALKFSPYGGTVTMRVEYPQTNRRHTTVPHFRLKILDEGPGISPENRNRIFDKFEIVNLQQDATENQVGLGLAFCKMVVDAHDGRIFVESNEPTGSIFTIEI